MSTQNKKEEECTPTISAPVVVTQHRSRSPPTIESARRSSPPPSPSSPTAPPVLVPQHLLPFPTHKERSLKTPSPDAPIHPQSSSGSHVLNSTNENSKEPTNELKTFSESLRRQNENWKKWNEARIVHPNFRVWNSASRTPSPSSRQRLQLQQSQQQSQQLTTSFRRVVPPPMLEDDYGLNIRTSRTNQHHRSRSRSLPRPSNANASAVNRNETTPPSTKAYPNGGIVSGLTNALGHIINDDDSESRHSDMDNLVKYHPEGYAERYARLITIFLHRNRWWLRYGLYIAVASFGVLVLAPAALAIFI